MSMTKYGAVPEQTSKTAQGKPGTYDAKPAEKPKKDEKK